MFPLSLFLLTLEKYINNSFELFLRGPESMTENSITTQSKNVIESDCDFTIFLIMFTKTSIKSPSC